MLLSVRTGKGEREREKRSGRACLIFVDGAELGEAWQRGRGQGFRCFEVEGERGRRVGNSDRSNTAAAAAMT